MLHPVRFPVSTVLFLFRPPIVGPTWILRSTIRAAVIPRDGLEEVLEDSLVPGLLPLVDD